MLHKMKILQSIIRVRQKYYEVSKKVEKYTKIHYFYFHLLRVMNELYQILQILIAKIVVVHFKYENLLYKEKEYHIT